MKYYLIRFAWVCDQLCACHAKLYARLCLFALPRHWSFWGSGFPFAARRAVTTTRRRPISYFHVIDVSVHVNCCTHQLVCYIYTARHLCIRLRRWRRTRMRTTAERPSTYSIMCIYVPDLCCMDLHPWLIRMFFPNPHRRSATARRSRSWIHRTEDGAWMRSLVHCTMHVYNRRDGWRIWVVNGQDRQMYQYRC